MAINIVVIAISTALLCYWLRAAWTIVASNEAARRQFVCPDLREPALVTLWDSAGGRRSFASQACISRLP